MNRSVAILLVSAALIGCEKAPPPPPPEVVAAFAYAPLAAGTSFRAELQATAVLPRLPSKKIKKKTGSLRPIDTETSIASKFYAELVEADPEKWRIDFETFGRSVGTPNGEQAESTFDLPDKAFFVQFAPEGPVVTDEVGGATTDSQSEYTVAVVNVLRERLAWGKFVTSREFDRGKIVESPTGIVLGHLVNSVLGPVTESNTTVAFFRFDVDAAKNELAHFDVHSRFRTDDPEDTDGNYLDLEANGRATVRVSDAALVGYEIEAKVIPRAKTGAMRPEGSGTWQMSFKIDTASFQAP